jgi:long-chain acyl-CoA synthetase
VPWAKAEGISFDSIEELTKNPKVLQLFTEVVETTNEKLARYEQIKKFEVLPLMLSIDGGHLTPTLKVKRRVVEKDYEDLIESIYQG